MAIYPYDFIGPIPPGSTRATAPVVGQQNARVQRRYVQPPPAVNPPPVPPPPFTPRLAPAGQVLGTFTDNTGNPVAGNASPGQGAPNRSIDEILRGEFEASQPAPVDENAIREGTRSQMQAQIDAINSYYADLVSREQEAGQGRLDKVRALNINSGLGGSNFASSADLQQRGLNEKVIRAVENERNLKLQEVYGNIDQIAREDIAAKKAEAQGKAEAFTAFKEKAASKAKQQLTDLAGAGIDLDQIDKNRKSYLLKLAGYDDALGELVYNSLKSKTTKIDYKAEKASDGKILLYGVDPKTGQLKTQRVNFDVPEGYEPAYVDGQLYYKNAATGDLIPSPMDQSLYTPDYKNYLLSKKDGGFIGSFEQWQTQDANRKRSVSNTYINSGGSGDNTYNLNSKEQANLNSIISQHQKSPLIAGADKATIFRGIAKDAETNFKDPTKQLAVIYGFVKILDLYESAVREGEITLSQQAMGYRQKLETAIQRVNGGQIVDQNTMKDYIRTGTAIADSMAESARQKDKQYEAQAKVNGKNVLSAWKDYRSGYTSSFDEPTNPSDGLSDDQAYEEYLKSVRGQ